MKINFRHEHVNVDTKTLYAWFPQLSRRSWVDGNDLMDDLNNRIHGRYGIKMHHIEYTLLEFFGRLGRHLSTVGEQTQIRVARVLLTQLATDAQNAWQSKGLLDLLKGFVPISLISQRLLLRYPLKGCKPELKQRLS